MLSSELIVSTDHIFSQSFPITNWNPWTVFSLALVYLIGVFFYSHFSSTLSSCQPPAFEKQKNSQHTIKKKYGITPLLLILNGMNFGLTTCGLGVIFYLTGFGWAWNCSPLTDSLLDSSIKHLIYLFLPSYVADCMRPVILMKNGHFKNAIHHAFHSTTMILFIYTFLRYDSSAASVFLPLIDNFVSSIRNAYLILIDTASGKRSYRVIHNFVIYLQFIQSILLLCHSIYILFVIKCQKISIFIQLIFSILALAYNTSKIIRFFSAFKPSWKDN